MNQPQGKVISLRSSTTGASTAVVEVEAAAACARCAAGKGCGAGLFSGSGTRRLDVEVPPSVDVVEGDVVTIDMAGGQLLPAALIVYGWPLAGAAAGSLLAVAGPWPGDIAAAGGALAGLVTGGLLASRRLASARCMERFRPVIVQRAGAGIAV